MTEAGDWTVEKVKEELPMVRVSVIAFGQRHECTGRVIGRKLKYAIVVIPEMPGSIEFAWETIADCLNNGRALHVGG